MQQPDDMGPIAGGTASLMEKFALLLLFSLLLPSRQGVNQCLSRGWKCRGRQ